ncbi:MAG: EAL domain-containing protein [Pseudomonadota bacterium]|nr:EAL domain-containing protein [Pseudomonadota bacterium]
MKMLGRRSLRQSLQALLLIVTSAALLIAVAGSAINEWFSSRAQVFQQLQTEADIIGSNSIGALSFLDEESAARTLATLGTDTNIVAAALFLPEGFRFASYQEIDGILPAVLPDSSSGTLSGYWFVKQPIVFDDEQLGSILVLADNSDWLKQQYFRLAAVSLVFAISLALAMLLSARLQRILTDPIFRLTETTRRITRSRDYSLRAERLSQDEVGSLVDDFNEMLNQIQKRDKDLREAQEYLEEKVEERTRELADLAHRYEHQAYHDSLTGLANRITFDHRLADGISHIKRYGGSLSVLFLDLDRFKMINDTLGHGIGDKLLKEVAQRLKSCLREDDTLARLGGDEFAILLLDTSPQGTGDVAAKVIETVCAPMELDGHALVMTTSVGVSMFPNDGSDAGTILKNADMAMYRSKDQGRNQLTFFSNDMNARVERRLLLENKLRQAIDNDLFYLCYQPKWNVQTLELMGVEALIRWNDPQEGAISPGEFISVAEECGLIESIDRWVLRCACMELLELFDGREVDVQLSVNFSPLHFARNRICDEIEAVLNETGFPSHCLELEITESLIGPGVQSVLEQLSDIRNLGVEISIDDFGTGYSSLSRLKQLPLNTLKIDRSFVNDLSDDEDSKNLVKTIITLAHNLNLKVVAEGVETDLQQEFIKTHNCDVVQGYLFGQPMTKDNLAEILVKE